MGELLKKIVEIIKFLEQGNEPQGKQWVKLREESIEVYRNICHQKGNRNVIEYIVSQLQGDYRGQLLVLSIIVKVFNDANAIICIMEILNKTEFDVYTRKQNRLQAIHLLQTSNMEGLEREVYNLKERLNQKILSQMRNILTIDDTYVPIAKRDRKKIVMVTNQLLGEKHAPSKIIVDIIDILKVYYDIDVYLIIAYDEYDLQELSTTWLLPVTLNKDSSLEGEYEIDYGLRNKIHGYQISIIRENLAEQQSLINRIYEISPMFIWKMGDVEIFSELFVEKYNVVAMNFTKDLPATECRIILRYLKGSSSESLYIENQIKKDKKEIIDFSISSIPSDNGEKNSDIEQLPKDAFPIIIAGNRLMEEISLVFLKTMEEILNLDERIYFIFIGEIDLSSLTNNKDLIQHCRCMGFAPNFYKAIGRGKLFINPPRTGGGAGGKHAIFNGIPVITLPNCDIANGVGEEFICNDLSEMVELVKRYVTDEEFYKKKQEQIRRRGEELKGVNLKEEIGIVLKKIETCIEKSEGERA